MNYATAVGLFKEAYPNAGVDAQTDLPKVQLAWTTFLDSLCKDGEITELQFNSWCCPYKRHRGGRYSVLVAVERPW